MSNVTISGVGAGSPGKRSAVSVEKDNATFRHVLIEHYTHAAIRLEKGSGHQIWNSTFRHQNKSTLGYGVLLRNDARNVTIQRNYFDNNSHSVATTGGRQQSYRAIGNWSTRSLKWHFDVHMGSDGWGGDKVEIVNNVTNGPSALLVVRGPFADGVYVQNNLYNRGAGDLVKLKPDATFTQNGTRYDAGNFYGPFFGPGTGRTKGQTFFSKGEIKNNCVNQNYNSLLSQAH